MRVLLALGGNAMTGPDGSATPDDQTRPSASRWSRVADLVAAGLERRAHPRQRPAGRQPAGQERARRARRAAGAAGLVRRADAGHHRLPRSSTRWTTRCADRGVDAPGGRRHPHPRRRRRPGLHPARPSRSAATCPREQAQTLIEHGQTWEDRGEKGWRRVVASPEPLEILDAARSRVLRRRRLRRRRRPAAAASPWSASPTARLRGVEAVIDKDLAAALLARALGGRRAGHRHRRRRTPSLGYGTADAAPARPGDRSPSCAGTPRAASSPAAAWAPRSRPPCGSSSRWRPAQRHHVAGPHRRRRRRAAPAPSSNR